MILREIKAFFFNKIQLLLALSSSHVLGVQTSYGWRSNLGPQAHWASSLAPVFATEHPFLICWIVSNKIAERPKSAWAVTSQNLSNLFYSEYVSPNPLLIYLEPAQINCIWEHCKNSLIVRENLFMTYLMHINLAVFNLEGWRDRLVERGRLNLCKAWDSILSTQKNTKTRSSWVGRRVTLKRKKPLPQL